MADPLPLPALNAWQATEVQLIGFPLAPQTGADQNWWNDLTGGDCTSTRKRLERVDSGPFKGREFALIIDPLKLAWKVDFLPDPESPTIFIGDFPETRDWFSELMQQWLAGPCPQIKRLAFAAKVMLPTESREKAYELLNDYLPFVDVDPNTREFLYRINRPRSSSAGIPDLRINRLVTWSAVKITMQMRMRAMSAAVGETITEQNLDGCLVQLDINTSEERTDALPHESLPAIWNELVQIGTELAQCGDIP